MVKMKKNELGLRFDFTMEDWKIFGITLLAALHREPPTRTVPATKTLESVER
jgi:hypothetical protein